MFSSSSSRQPARFSICPRLNSGDTAASHYNSAGLAQGARILRTALGPAIARFLEDPSVEVMLNPDGRLSVYLDSTIMNRLAEHAARRDLSRSVIAEAAIDSFLSPDKDERLVATAVLCGSRRDVVMRRTRLPSSRVW